jgi:pimeloyl-ACP methyl ester carboxylesterase
VLLFHQEDGSGPDVVLLHSGVADGSSWEPQAEALAPHFRVIRPDLRGFGRSPLPHEPYTNAGDVLNLLDHLDVSACHVVGSSMGGQVALEMAVTRPERVASLVLLCPAFGGLDPSDVAQAFGDREAALLEAGAVDEAVELNVETWLGPEASTDVRDRVRRMQRHAFDVQLAADADPTFPWPDPVDVDPSLIRAPTLVVSGNHDMDHFHRVARHLASSIPDARLSALPWAGHLPGVERPQLVSDLLLEFLLRRSTPD